MEILATMKLLYNLRVKYLLNHFFTSQKQMENHPVSNKCPPYTKICAQNQSDLETEFTI